MLSAVQNRKNLRRLGLSGTTAEVPGSIVDVLVLEYPSLCSLDLSAGWDDGFDAQVGAAFGGPSLLRARLPQQLPNFASLSRLCLRHCKMGVQGAAQLAAALPLHPKLAVLDLAGNELECQGVATLAATLQCCGRLQCLGLRDNGIGAHWQGAEALREALQGWSSAIADAQTLFADAQIADSFNEAPSSSLYTCWPKVRTPGQNVFRALVV